MSDVQRTIRWGILATGGIAATFTEALATVPDAEVVAVGSRSPEGAKAFAERFGIPRAYGSWAELAADEEVDVVYVATPHSAHRAAAGLCLEAGKAVLCEKAFTLNSREARGPEDWQRTFERHVRVVEAIRAGDPAAAEAAMNKHFEAAEAAIAELANHREDHHGPEDDPRP